MMNSISSTGYDGFISSRIEWERRNEFHEQKQQRQNRKLFLETMLPTKVRFE